MLSHSFRCMMRSSIGNISVLLTICAGNSPVTHTKASDAELWFFFDLRLNERLNKQSWGWWFETLSHPLWRHCNVEERIKRKWVSSYSPSKIVFLCILWCVLAGTDWDNNVSKTELCYGVLRLRTKHAKFRNVLGYHCRVDGVASLAVIPQQVNCFQD